MSTAPAKPEVLANWSFTSVVAKYRRTRRRLYGEIAVCVLPNAAMIAIISGLIGRLSLGTTILALIFGVPLAFTFLVLYRARVQQKDSERQAEHALPGILEQGRNWPWTVLGFKRLDDGNFRFTVMREFWVTRFTVPSFQVAPAARLSSPAVTFGTVQFVRRRGPVGVHGGLEFLGPLTVWVSAGQDLPNEPDDLWTADHV